MLFLTVHDVLGTGRFDEVGQEAMSARKGQRIEPNHDGDSRTVRPKGLGREQRQWACAFEGEGVRFAREPQADAEGLTESERVIEVVGPEYEDVYPVGSKLLSEAERAAVARWNDHEIRFDRDDRLRADDCDADQFRQPRRLRVDRDEPRRGADAHQGFGRLRREGYDSLARLDVQWKP